MWVIIHDVAKLVFVFYFIFLSQLASADSIKII